MPSIDPHSPILAVLTAFAMGFALGILPLGLAEVAAVAIGVVEPPGLALAMLAAFTLAHVAAKLPWYALGVRAERLRHPRAHAFTERARALAALYPSFGFGLLFASALTSMPPFHLAAIASGLVRLPLVRVVLICLAGRTMRFGALAALPALIRVWIA